MAKTILIFGALLLVTQIGHAQTKPFEKAKLELISEIETLVNIEECRKDVQAPEVPQDRLPKSCDKIEYLSKYSFTKKDAASIYDYLNQEESRLTMDAKKIVDSYKIKNLGKMFLSKKCILNRELVDMDKYLAKIKQTDSELIVESGEKHRIPATGSDINVNKDAPEVIPK